MKKEALLKNYKPKRMTVDIKKILVDRVKVSEGFKSSFTELGHASEILLNHAPNLVEGKEYRVIDGRKTVNALMDAGIKKVDADVYDNLPEELEDYVLLVRNLQRQHSPVVEAEAFQKRIKAGKSQKEISEITGINPSIISQRLALLKLPRRFLDELRANEITYSVAKRITSLPKDVQNNLVKTDGKITGEIVEEAHRKYVLSQLSFDDIELPKKPRDKQASIKKYSIKYDKEERPVTRRELLSVMEDILPKLDDKKEIIIKRI
jgi:ParB/RepB/Spo0J family partition protein